MVYQNSRSRCQSQPSYSCLMENGCLWITGWSPDAFASVQGPLVWTGLSSKLCPTLCLTFRWLSALLKGSEPLHMPISLPEMPLLIPLFEDLVQGSPLQRGLPNFSPRRGWSRAALSGAHGWSPAFPALFGNIFLICLPSGL